MAQYTTNRKELRKEISDRCYHCPSWPLCQLQQGSVLTSLAVVHYIASRTEAKDSQLNKKHGQTAEEKGNFIMKGKQIFRTSL